MAKSIPALITPEVLAWARTLDSISVGEIAAKLKVETSIIQDWESGGSNPTIKQAKELAKLYRVPFAYFYLPDIPKKVKRIEKTDYRTFGNIGDSFVMSRELRWLLRDVEERREAMLSLYEEERTVVSFPLKLHNDAKEAEIVAAIRNLLGLTPQKQITFRKPEVALAHCISMLENYDVLVFQATKIDTNEMRGMSMAYDEMPIIVLNRKDEPSARLFSLCHELAHIVTRTSGICNDFSTTSQNQIEWELACNRIAGKVLVPIELLAMHKSIQSIRQYGFDDSYVMTMARDYAVSKEVIIHALWDMKIITKQMYFDTLNRYSEEYKQFASHKKKGFLPPATDVVSQVGKLYARTVLGAFYSERISARDTSGYLLNLKVKHFQQLERRCY